MLACPQCGTKNDVGTPHCGRCGAPLPVTRVPSAMKQTMMGMPGPDYGAQPNAPSPRTSTSRSATLLGIAGPTPDALSGPAPAGVAPSSPSAPAATHVTVGENSSSSKLAGPSQTLLGVAAPHYVPAASLPQSGPAPQTQSANEPTAKTPDRSALGRTMLGGHSASPPPQHVQGSTSPLPSASRSAGTTTQVGYGPGPSTHPQDQNPRTTAILHPGAESAPVASTLLGMVAPPPPAYTSPEDSGAAPPPAAPNAEIKPAETWTEPSAPQARSPGTSPPQPALGPMHARPNALPIDTMGGTGEWVGGSGLSRGSAQRNRKSGLLLVVLAAFLFLAIGAFVFLWHPPKPLTAQVKLGEQGKEVLTLGCEGCPDGTLVKLRGQKAEFAQGTARLPLHSPLSVGDNELRVQLERPGIGRDEEVRLNVPVRFRVLSDHSELNAETPKLLIQVEAEPGATVVVADQPVSLKDGKGKLALDIRDDILGQAKNTKTLSRTTPYVVTFADGSSESGEVRSAVQVSPLLIEAPGESAITDSEHFMLAGRTAPGGAVSVAGRAITVDPEGQFAQLMSIDSVGETKIFVRASLAEHAPRLVRLRVKRVSDLKEEAKAFAGQALDNYALLLGQLDSQGQAVALSGKLEEVRVTGQSTVLLLDVKDGCKTAPCFARVLVGSKKKAEKGARVEVFGHLTRGIEGPIAGRKIPEIRAEFVLATAER